MDKKDIVAITLLFLISFVVWTLPLKGQKYPFGEGDAAHQFGIADWMATSDTAQREYPFYIAVWYGHINEKNFYAPVYAPPYFINLATFQIIGTDRFLSKGIFIAIISIFLSIASIYFVTRKLFGFFPAIAASFLIIFELRLVMSYIWGQRPILAAIGMIPMVFYCYYRYVEFRKQGKDKVIYLVFMGIFMAFSGIFYPLTIAFEALVLGLYSFILLFKDKKLPFNFKHLIIAIAVFSVLFSPFFIDYKNQKGMNYEGFKIQKVSSLFKWFDPGENPDNAFLYSYSKVNGGYWTIPLLLFGLVILFVKKKDKYLLVLSWLIGLYLILHLEIIGFEQGKLTRIFKATSQIFYILIGIGLISIANLFKSKNVRVLSKYVLIVMFVLLTIAFNARPIYSTLKGAYSPIERITDNQYDAAQWISKNLQTDANIYPIGTLTYPKYRWMHMFSQRAFNAVTIEWTKAHDWLAKQPLNQTFTHVLIDYSDMVLLDNQGAINNLRQFEQLIAQNGTLIYDQNFIKVYKLGS